MRINKQTRTNIETILNHLKGMSLLDGGYDTRAEGYVNGTLRFAPVLPHARPNVSGATRSEFRTLYNLSDMEVGTCLKYLRNANLVVWKQSGRERMYMFQSLSEFLQAGGCLSDWDNGPIQLRGDYGPAYEVPHDACRWYQSDAVVSVHGHKTPSNPDGDGRLRWDYFPKSYLVKHMDGVEPADRTPGSARVTDSITQERSQSARSTDQRIDSSDNTWPSKPDLLHLNSSHSEPTAGPHEEGIELDEDDEHLLDTVDDDLKTAGAVDSTKAIEAALRGDWSQFQNAIAAE